MKKDSTILDLLRRLTQLLDASGITIKDHWDGDLCAIGLQKADRLVYISTFDESAYGGNFYYELEVLLPDAWMPSKTITSRAGVSETDLIVAIKNHLLV